MSFVAWVRQGGWEEEGTGEGGRGRGLTTVTILTAGVRPGDAADVLPEVFADFIESLSRRDLRNENDLAENGADDAQITPF